MVRKSAQFLPGPDQEAEDAEYTVEFDDASTKTAHDDALESFINALRDSESSARILIKRELVDGKSPMAHCGSVPVDKYNFVELIDYILQNWGGGDYRLQIMGKTGCVANRLVTIAEPIRPKSEAPGASYGGEFNVMLGKVLETMERQQQQITDLARNNNGLSKREMLEELQMMKEILGSGSTQQSVNPLEQMRDMAMLFKEFGFGTEREGSFSDFVPLIEKLMDKADQEPVALPQPQRKPNPQPRKEPNQMNFMLKMGIAQLLRAAAKGSDPGAYAQMVVDQLPAEVIQEFFTKDNGLEQVYKMDARLRDYTQWVEELAEHVKQLVGLPSKVADQYLTPEEESDTTSHSLGAPEEKPDDMAPKLDAEPSSTS